MAERKVEKTQEKVTKKVEKPSVKTTASKKAEPKATAKKVGVATASKKTEVRVSAPVYDLKGKSAGTVSLPRELFSAKVNEVLVSQAVRVYLANQRQGTSSTKTRSEVTGSRRKVWRQKGTGRARHGSITGPVFVGGGIVHGPKPRDYSLKMPKKMKLQALMSALTMKNNEKMIFVMDGAFSGKTKEFATSLKSIIGDAKKQPSVLFIYPKADKAARAAARNVARVDVITADSVNTYGVMKNAMMIITKDAIGEMEKTFIKA